MFLLAWSVVRTLLYCAESIVTDPTDEEAEIADVKIRLQEACGYTDWTFIHGQPKGQDILPRPEASRTSNRVLSPYRILKDSW